ncbi:hypothetical protein [Blastococcus sp. PRF04-17]|uniref:hypothetical protein n=1 Tax=Blastococcus sp. PRF04-17 TaxID=2933797 RepID=UPI001FF66B34|nr:hypothetical protein [Blastococcus sp. PRF04-17]UOY02745.1 hypothetical protein MVA48_05100 [Blastococcus sp. PRF04-17]
MADDRMQHVEAEAAAQPAAEVGWQPVDWAAELRRRRSAEWRNVTLLVAVLLAVPLVSTLVLERPMGASDWIWLALALLVSGDASLSHATASGRVQWEEAARQEVRIEHALRTHVSIGAGDRELVTKRARAIRWWSTAAFVVCPLLCAAALAGMQEAGLNVVGRAAASVAVVLVCGLLVVSRWRRLRLARRWLGDPLPRETGPQW